MQQMRKQLLVLIHRVNVYYSNTLNTADAVTCLLNIAHRALDSHSVPIRSTTPIAPEPFADQTVSELASSSESSLPTPPRTLDADTASLSTRAADIIPMADDILSSLVMILIQYPRSKRMASLTSQDDTPAWTETKATSDDCDLTDALIEMVYALLDHDHYRERPLATRLSEFLVQIALQRERKFREQERQKRKPLLPIRSGSYSSGRFIDRWRQGRERLNGTSGSGVDDSGRMESDTFSRGGIDSVEIDMQSKIKKRVHEQQSKRCQERLDLDRQGLQHGDWGDEVMGPSEMASPFLVN
ncbi:hypothetical protein BGZ95_002737 [Linnemannia exigua]|uniref:Uncharacterized protein n=1 Tax=Linnemannia exigua TaxID=604196 RepID=A0AAD4D5Q1_9FUNG|nr:hypothetical protein BGZ95_002737 [Linnemannia exigua]